MDAISYLLVILTLTISRCLGQNDLTIDTTSGQVVGFNIHTSIAGQNVTGFLGVPYGEPPVGKLRFRPPVKIGKSERIIRATQRSKSCIQLLPSIDLTDDRYQDWIPRPNETSEDCLYLNIWVPSPKPNDAAVMVWIHGGGYEAGSANSLIYDGQILASKGVILVSMNYRLGVLGFLTLDKEEAPGNMGLMDQALALKWVQDNIANFGGSRDKVTIFGESAGAGSVGHHLLLPSSQGLFQRAILQSGAATSPWSVSNNRTARRKALEFVRHSKCNDTGVKNPEILNCLRSISVTEIVKLSKNMTHLMPGQLVTWNPVVDGVYYPDYPNKLLNQRKFNRTDILLGVMIDDGAIFPVADGTIPITDDPHVSEELFENYFKAITGNASDHLVKLIKPFYVEYDGEAPISNWRRGVAELANDFSFKCGMNTLADAGVANGNRVYYYQFEYKSSVSIAPSWVGATHAEDNIFVFGIPFMVPHRFKPEELGFSGKVLNYWTEFAKKGDPNSHDLSLQWPIYDTQDKKIFRLDRIDSIQHGMRIQTCNFINPLVDQLTRRS